MHTSTAEDRALLEKHNCVYQRPCQLMTKEICNAKNPVAVEAMTVPNADYYTTECTGLGILDRVVFMSLDLLVVDVLQCGLPSRSYVRHYRHTCWQLINN